MRNDRSAIIHDEGIPIERRAVSLILCLAAEKRREIERATEGILQSYVQVKLLHALVSEPEGRLTVSELSSRIEEPIPNVSRTLNRLVDLGFVEKVRSTEDQRTVHVSITGAGRRAQQEADARLMDLTTGLGKADLERLFDLLLKAYENTAMRTGVQQRTTR